MRSYSYFLHLRLKTLIGHQKLLIHNTLIHILYTYQSEKKNISCIESVNSECFDARSFAEFLSEFYLYCLKFHGNQFNGQLACFVRHAQLYQNQISNRLREQPSTMVSKNYQVDYISLLSTIRLLVVNLWGKRFNLHNQHMNDF